MHLLGGGDKHEYKTEYGKKINACNMELDEAIKLRY